MKKDYNDLSAYADYTAAGIDGYIEYYLSLCIETVSPASIIAEIENEAGLKRVLILLFFV